MTNSGKIKILLTGFVPFGGETVNPAQLIVEALELQRPDVDLHKAILPVSFLQSKKIMEDLITEIEPDAILSIGQSGGCSEVKVERFAINLNDATKSDNDGDTPFERKIYEDGENVYFASIPTKEIVRNIREMGIPALLSNSAGLYVCNNVMYTALHCIKSYQRSAMAGFIHVPYLPQQAVLKEKKPSMSLQDMTTAIETALNTIISEIQATQPETSIS